MKKIVDVYRCTKKSGAYIYLAKGSLLERLPSDLLAHTGTLELAMTLVLTPEKKLAQAKASKVLKAIEEQGFYLQLPPQPDAYMRTISNDKLTLKPV